MRRPGMREEEPEPMARMHSWRSTEPKRIMRMMRTTCMQARGGCCPLLGTVPNQVTGTGGGMAVGRGPRCTGGARAPRGGGHVRPQCCGAAQGHQAQGAQRLAPGRRCCSPPSPRRPPGAQPAARSARGRGQGRSRGLGQAAEHSWMRRLAAGPLGLPASKQHRRTGRPAQPSPAQHRRTCVTQMAVLSASCQKEPWRT